MPLFPTLVLAGSFGCLFCVAAVGLYFFIGLEARTVSLQIGTLFNVVAGAMVTAMLITQMAIRSTVSDLSELELAVPELLPQIIRSIHSVQLGLDVVWDIFVCVGTFLVAANMTRHSRLGKGLAFSGMILVAALLILNLTTFPTPPGEAGLIDLGPLLGVWYLLVTIRIGLSLSWVKEQLYS